MVYANIITMTHTATDDLIFRLANVPMWFREANIHITTQDALYGDKYNQPATVTAGDILVFNDFNLSELYFRNAGAGANTVIHLVGILMTTGRQKDLEIPLIRRGD